MINKRARKLSRYLGKKGNLTPENKKKLDKWKSIKKEENWDKYNKKVREYEAELNPAEDLEKYYKYRRKNGEVFNEYPYKYRVDQRPGDGFISMG